MPHIPGQQADGTTEGFDWYNPLNKLVADSYRSKLDQITRIRRLFEVENNSAVDGGDALGIALATELFSITSLPPFPLPGENADLNLLDLTIAAKFWQEMQTWMMTQHTFDVEVPGTTIPVTDTPLQVFRRVMSGVGK